MAVFNTNQNRQFYVVGAVVTDLPSKVKAKTAKEGDIELGKTEDGKQIWFRHFGKGGLTRTDIIDVDKSCYAKLTTKAQMQRKPKKATVTLSADVNGGEPINGQDYILRLQVKNYLSPGDASVLIRSGVVRATKNMGAADFYKKMAESLERNFSRDPQPLLTFEHSADGLVIKEVVDQPWRLGVLSQESVNFEIMPTTIIEQGNEVVWVTLDDKGYVPVIEDTEAAPVGNGKQVADLEYFCMAERGDMFRNMGWPNNIDVKYMVDPEKEYDMLDLHYFFSGNGVQVHKSEKDITFVASDTAVMTALKTAITGAGITVQ